MVSLKGQYRGTGCKDRPEIVFEGACQIVEAVKSCQIGNMIKTAMRDRIPDHSGENEHQRRKAVKDEQATDHEGWRWCPEQILYLFRKWRQKTEMIESRNAYCKEEGHGPEASVCRASQSKNLLPGSEALGVRV